MNIVKNCNDVYLAGVIKTNFAFDYKIGEKNFYSAQMEVMRLSKEVDIIKIVIPAEMLSFNTDYTDVYAEVYGSYRTYKKDVNGRKRLVPSVFVKDLIPWYNSSLPRVSALKNNQIVLSGRVIQQPVFRVTPKKREITELMVAIERKSGKNDYIPCIAWNENAIKAAAFMINEEVQLTGRIQSRIYLQNGESYQVNEISVRKLAPRDLYSESIA